VFAAGDLRRLQCACVEPLLESDAGPVRGAWCDGFAVFRGVPYAERAAWDALEGEAP
jgi:hypothetical protein